MSTSAVHLLWSSGHEWAPEGPVCPGGPLLPVLGPASPGHLPALRQDDPKAGDAAGTSSPSLTQTRRTLPASGSGVKSPVSTGK